ncbi:LOW QUALITY PROTEIN: Rve-domain-containing hypothetical protein [Phytophthora megakarya]|uniref:Integrase catalytic domain-containing protein n=1 Tax=Phytophthora megakarya TaxID=4795 RepID=A0A225WIY1_9STRA|nr:LOW QUALITY PROTEIN: Rve-domain-containing hypothetical protein [Phytophthora megakarya]
MDSMKTKSKGGARYVLGFVDDYSRYVVTYFLKKKSDVANKFKLFLTMHKNQWGERIKCLRSENGNEFVKKSMDKIRQQYGIIHQKPVPYSLQQNNVSKHMNRTIMVKTRSMLQYKGVSAMWWAEAVKTTMYLINQSTNSKRSTTPPYDLSFKTKPRLNHLRVFGPIGYAHVDKSKRTKLEAKMFKCMFLGYTEDSKGYRVYDLESNKVKIGKGG